VLLIFDAQPDNSNLVLLLEVNTQHKRLTPMQLLYIRQSTILKTCISRLVSVANEQSNDVLLALLWFMTHSHISTATLADSLAKAVNVEQLR
jgi:hypothetical protein